MKCPLRTKIERPTNNIEVYGFGDCIRENCAWWDEGSDACAIWAIMSSFDALGGLFREIEQKMPAKLHCG